MYRRALRGSERVLGREHPDSLTNASNLGSVLDSQGKSTQAEAMSCRALEARHKMFVREQSYTAISLNVL
jgi:hypothetical protein